MIKIIDTDSYDEAFDQSIEVITKLRDLLQKEEEKLLYIIKNRTDLFVCND